MERVGKIFRSGLLKSISDGIASSQATFVISYSSMTAKKMESFRKGMKKLGARVYVSKNRIAKLALKEMEHGSIAEDVTGQTAFAWTNEDSAAVSKALLNFGKECEGFKVHGGLVDGVVLSDQDVRRLADLPSKEVLQAQLLGTLAAPVTRFMGALNAKTRDLLSILKQYSEKKGGN